MKQLTATAVEVTDYKWPRINVISRWYKDTQHTAIIIFDPPPALSDQWTSALLQQAPHAELDSPFWIYPVLGNLLVGLQDTSVWTCRDLVRAVEKDRMGLLAERFTYESLHNLSRHIIHVSEVLDVGAQVVEAIQQHRQLFEARQPDRLVPSGIPQELMFIQTMLNSLKKRSDSNMARLQNEISLCFNVVTQRQAHVSVQIGEAAKRDGEAMRVIAAVTLLFLPSTFVSAIFSTSFFNYDHGAGVWAISDKFWIYWAVAIPLTVVSVLTWVLWTRRRG